VREQGSLISPNVGRIHVFWQSVTKYQVCLFVCYGSTPNYSVLCVAKSLCTLQVVDSNLVPEFVIRVFKEIYAVWVRPCRTLLVCCVKMDCVSLLLIPSTTVTSVTGREINPLT
jgi:hypothetical protein